MAAGTIFAGMFREPYDRKDPHSRFGVALSLVAAFVVIIVISDPFKGLIYSQMALSVQLPFTVPAGSPDFLGEGDGKIPQFALDQVVALRHRRSRDMAERHAVR